MTKATRHRIFLLSPAYAGGQRARMILSERAGFELARKLRSKKGAPIAEVFTFLSGLYFRGKIAYATALAHKLPLESEVILLGSIATGKYVDVLLAAFRDRLRFPSDFIGRGDMSRGGLMLRCAADRQELPYIAVAGAIVNGKRPPKLTPRRYFGPEDPDGFRMQDAHPPDAR